MGENLQAQIAISSHRFANARGEGRSIDEQMRGAAEGQWIRTSPMSAEHIEAAHGLGLQLTDYAERVTHAGGLAGAVDMLSTAVIVRWSAQRRP